MALYGSSSFMGISPFLLLFLLGYCLAVIEGELRCYCNESGCVATGYMCKSAAGRCFTAVEVRGEVTHQTHGCLDSLPEQHRQACRRVVDVVSASAGKESGRGTGGLPLLLCCDDHMCNYREDLDVSIILTPKFNGTFQRGSGSGDSAVYSRHPPDQRGDDRDLWFKAAVIAVPIAGGFILVLLVLLAVRMLKTDSRHHRRLIEIRRERSLTKAHMYITDHLYGLGKTNQHHCSLFNEKTKTTTCVPVFSDTPPTTVIGVCPTCCGSESFQEANISIPADNAKHSDSNRSTTTATTTASVPHNNCPVCSNGNKNSKKLFHFSHSPNGGGGFIISTNTSDNTSSSSLVTHSLTSDRLTSDSPHSHTAVPVGKPDSPVSRTGSPHRTGSPSHCKEVSVRLDREGHLFSQIGRPCVRGGDSAGQSAVSTWEKVCTKGPMANV